MAESLAELRYRGERSCYAEDVFACGQKGDRRCGERGVDRLFCRQKFVWRWRERGEMAFGQSYRTDVEADALREFFGRSHGDFGAAAADIDNGKEVGNFVGAGDCSEKGEFGLFMAADAGDFDVCGFGYGFDDCVAVFRVSEGACSDGYGGCGGVFGADTAVIMHAGYQPVKGFRSDLSLFVNVFAEPYDGLFVTDRYDLSGFRVEIGNEQECCVGADVYA